MLYKLICKIKSTILRKEALYFKQILMYKRYYIIHYIERNILNNKELDG